MKQIKVCEATPIQLDWLVATCEGYTNLRRNPHRFAQHLIMNRGGNIKNLSELNYPTDWAQGGPIIERERITLDYYCNQGESRAALGYASYDIEGEYIEGSDHEQTGQTPLEAAMRCYVSSRLGPEVEIPNEL